MLAAVLVVAAFYMEGLYRLRRGTSYLDEFYRLFNGVATVTIVLMVGNFMFQPAYHSRLVYGIAGILILIFTATGPGAESTVCSLAATAGSGHSPGATRRRGRGQSPHDPRVAGESCFGI